MQPLDDGVPFATFIMRVVGLVVDDQQVAGAAGDSFGKIHLLLLLRGRLRAEHGSYRVRFIVLRALSSFVKLMNVGQEENPFGMRSLPLPRMTQSKSQKMSNSFGRMGSSRKIFPAAKSALRRSSTITLGAISRNVLA